MDRVGKNTSKELNTKRVISMEASQMLPIPVFFGGRASFSTLIQMTSTINLCKAVLVIFFFPPSEQAILATASFWGEGEGRGQL